MTNLNLIWKYSKGIIFILILLLIISIVLLVNDLKHDYFILEYRSPEFIFKQTEDIISEEIIYVVNLGTIRNKHFFENDDEFIQKEKREIINSIYFTTEQQKRIPLEYTLDEIRMLCTMVYGECGAIANDVSVTFYDGYTIVETIKMPAKYMHSICTMVLLNRINDSRFPDNIYDNLVKPNQYNIVYTYESQSYSYLKGIGSNWSNVVDAVLDCLNGEFIIPENVIYQSNFNNLGKSYYATIYVDTGYFRSTSYYAYG